MIYLVILFLICLIIICLFSYSGFSPIPYFPTNHKDLDLIIKTFKLKNNQIIYDLGAGSGTVILEAAKYAKQKNLNTQFIAIEINPILVLILNLKKLLHVNRENIKIIWADLFKYKFEMPNPQFNNVTIYLYASPWLLEKIIKHVQTQFQRFSAVSYMYPIKSLKKKEKVVSGENKIFVYE